jgi:hypothetical protein
MADVTPPDFSEGMWRRAGRDWLASMERWWIRLLVISVDVAATAVGALWSAAQADKPEGAAWWEIALGACVGIIAGTLLTAIVLILFHLARAPFRQRDDARVEAIGLYREAHPEFPQHALSVEPMWYADLPDKFDASRETRVLFLPIEYTNRDPTRRVSLDFDLLWHRDVQGQVMGPYVVSHYRGRNIPDVLSTPLAVEPQTHIKGDLSFDASGASWVFEFGELTEVSVNGWFRVYLRVTDHVTGAALEFPVPRSREVKA